MYAIILCTSFQIKIKYFAKFISNALVYKQTFTDTDDTDIIQINNMKNYLINSYDYKFSKLFLFTKQNKIKLREKRKK